METILAEGDQSLLRSWELHLRAAGRSPRTIALYREHLRRFGRWCTEEGHGGLLDATRASVETWIAGQRDAGVAANTIRNRWVALRSFYRWVVEEEEIERSPVAKVKVAKADTPPPDVLTDEELGLLLKACRGADFKARRDYAIVRLLAGTGMRLAEVADLERGDIDLATRIVLVRHGKGDRSRLVRVDAETAAALDRYLRSRDRHRLAATPYLWVGHRGRFTTKGIRVMIAQPADAAGIGHVHPHRLRHTYAHRFLARGGNEGDLQLLGGWDSPGVMRRYGSHLARERALAAADDVDVLRDL